MTQAPNRKKYDLEERTFKFAERVAGYVNALPQTASNLESGRQLVRAAGSLWAPITLKPTRL